MCLNVLVVLFSAEEEFSGSLYDNVQAWRQKQLSDDSRMFCSPKEKYYPGKFS